MQRKRFLRDANRLRLLSEEVQHDVADAIKSLSTARKLALVVVVGFLFSVGSLLVVLLH